MNSQSISGPQDIVLRHKVKPLCEPKGKLRLNLTNEETTHTKVRQALISHDTKVWSGGIHLESRTLEAGVGLP